MKGVTYHKGKNRWRARKNVNGETVHLGWFKTEEGAIEALEQFIEFNSTPFSNGFTFETDYEETPVSRVWRGWSDNFFTRLYKKLRSGNV